MAIRWRDTLTIDGGLVDSDHRHLIAIINRFDEGCTADGNRLALCCTLCDLRHFAGHHFAREERLMREAAYPPDGLHRHEDAHRALLERLDTLVRHYEGSADADDLAEVVWETADLLKHWLADHLIRFDLPLKPYLGHPAAPVPRPAEDGRRATAARF